MTFLNYNDSMRRLAGLFLLCAVLSSGADMSVCACDVSKPETLEAKECGLCKQAERQPAEPPVFFLKDNSPTKPNRWLALPRVHGEHGDPLKAMSAELRLQLWSMAIEKAKSLWGDQWGLAINGLTARTQCHAHIHIGKLLDGVETAQFLVVDGPGDIPAPQDDGGIWVHPVDGKLHVHLVPETTETVLVR